MYHLLRYLVIKSNFLHLVAKTSSELFCRYFFLSKLDVFILFEMVISIGHIFSYVPIWAKFCINSSFHGKQISGIYVEKSRTKHSIDIPNGCISEQNGSILSTFSTEN